MPWNLFWKKEQRAEVIAETGNSKERFQPRTGEGCGLTQWPLSEPQAPFRLPLHCSAPDISLTQFRITVARLFAQERKAIVNWLVQKHHRSSSYFASGKTSSIWTVSTRGVGFSQSRPVLERETKFR